VTAPDAAGTISAPAGSQRIEPVGLAGGTRVAIVAAEYHTDIVQPLVDGAVAECLERGVGEGHISIIPIPGAFEVVWLPSIARRMATTP
jgi:6,7-dimethyl-8-ribityllumazine synthase